MNILDYPELDSSLSFTDYIAHCRHLIEKHRVDLEKEGRDRNLIINANSPFELTPSPAPPKDERIKYGVLLIHGLLDCPFSLRDIGHYLQQKGMFCRAVLLPGHGTTPADLIGVSYQDWIKTVHYGIESLRKEVDIIFMVGYSTGAALSVFHAMHDVTIAGIILIAPAIQIKIPNHLIVGWHYLKHYLNRQSEWLYREEEVDYTKYLSIAYHPVQEVGKLTRQIHHLHQLRKLSCKVFMAISREDETISSQKAIEFFLTLPHRDSKLLLYTTYKHPYKDPRIVHLINTYPDLCIRHFSHASLPFAPTNPHYGQQGDYKHTSQIHAKNIIYGAYNPIQTQCLNFLHKLKFIKNRHSGLTYNPDFNYMADQIYRFITE